MKKIIIKMIPVAFVGMMAMPAAQASDGATLFQEAGCAACHQVDKKRMGPMFKDVAAKYKGQENAEEQLFNKVRAGGAGNWGNIPMPPNPPERVSDEELHTIVKWILTL